MTETHRVLVGSVEYVDFPVEAENDPTLFPVEVAIVATGSVPNEDESDWRAADWQAEGPTGVWRARLLVGSSGIDTDYPAGLYDAFVRITAAPEVPVLEAGGIELYSSTLPVIIDGEDLADFLGAELDTNSASVAFACSVASDVVRAKLRQTVTLVEDDALRIEGVHGDRITLPERPVVEVSSVAVDGFTFPPSGYHVIGDELILVSGSETFASRASGLGSWGGSGVAVDIVYSHGYAAVPQSIRGLACSIASRIVENPQGVTSEGVLSYSVSFGDPASFPLLPFEEDVVSLYRRRAGTLSTR